jgi:hypothetical protein
MIFRKVDLEAEGRFQFRIRMMAFISERVLLLILAGMLFQFWDPGIVKIY